jgi:hypothetical protein
LTKIPGHFRVLQEELFSPGYSRFSRGRGSPGRTFFSRIFKVFQGAWEP